MTRTSKLKPIYYTQNAISNTVVINCTVGIKFGLDLGLYNIVAFQSIEAVLLQATMSR